MSASLTSEDNKFKECIDRKDFYYHVGWNAQYDIMWLCICSEIQPLAQFEISTFYFDIIT